MYYIPYINYIIRYVTIRTDTIRYAYYLEAKLEPLFAQTFAVNGTCGGARGRAVRDMQRGPDHPEVKNISPRRLDFLARAGLNVFPYGISMRSELSSEAKMYLRRSRYSSPRPAPRTASRQ